MPTLAVFQLYHGKIIILNNNLTNLQGWFFCAFLALISYCLYVDTYPGTVAKVTSSSLTLKSTLTVDGLPQTISSFISFSEI